MIYKAYKNVKGTRALIVYFEKQIVTLKDSLHDVKKETQRRMIENSIKKIQSDLKVAKDVLKGHLDKKMVQDQKKHEQQMELQKKAAKEAAENNQEAEKVIKTIEAEKESSKTTPKGKTEEVKGHEKEAKTTSQINKSAKETFSKIVK